MKKTFPETLNKLGYLVSPKKQVAKKQHKVLKMLETCVGDFHSYYGLKNNSTLVDFWNNLSPEIRQNPGVVVAGITSSSNYRGMCLASISVKGVKSRSEEIYKLLEYKIHPNHKMSLFEFVSKYYKEVICGSGVFSYYRNTSEGWIAAICKSTVPSSRQGFDDFQNMWIHEDDWSSRKVEVAMFLKTNQMGISNLLNSLYHVRTLKSNNLQIERTPTLMEKWADIQDRISNVSPINWSRSLTPFEYKLATRQKPEGECIGIELEFVCRESSNIEKWDGDDFPKNRWNHFTTDGSITTDSPDEAVARYQEFKSFTNINSSDDWEFVSSTLKNITDNGAIVNKSCGCHIHIDMRNRPQATYYRIAQRVRTSFQTWLHRIVSPRRATNRYCSVWADSSASRYSAVNTHCWNEHRTIEIRLGMPTLNISKLKCWAKLMFWIVNNSNKCDTLEEFMNSDCPLDLKIFVITRISRFNRNWETHISNNVHTSAIPPTSQSLPNYQKWENVINIISSGNHEFTNDQNLQ